jgi:DNA polymerase-3 subunit beta
VGHVTVLAEKGLVKPLLLEVSQKSLYTALLYINPAVSNKGVIPILTGIKLHVDYSGLILTASNTAMLMQFKIPNDNVHLIVHNTGSIVISSRYFIDIIRNLPHDLIKIEIIEDLNVYIQSGKAKYNLNGMNPEEYPQIINQEHYSRLSFSNHHLKQLIRRVAFAVSSSEARPALTGVSYEINNDQLRFSASDGIRLSSQTTNKFISEHFDNFLTVIIPGKHLFDLSKVLNDEHSTTDITIGSNTITFNTNNSTFAA